MEITIHCNKCDGEMKKSKGRGSTTINGILSIPVSCSNCDNTLYIEVSSKESK